MILVVDYGRGNLFSIGQALRHLGADFEISGDPAKLATAGKVILPGVGAFGDCMQGLRERELIAPLRELPKRGVPLLGICVGMQVLAGQGEEFGLHEGLGLIPGTVKRLPEDETGQGIRIPNVGWRRLHVKAGHADLFGTDGDGPMVYFVHSYAPVPENADHVAATIAVNGREIAAVIRKGPIAGFQFHPEKSGAVGLAMLSRFLNA